MSCNQISRSGTIQLNSGSLGSNFCHKSWQKTYEDFIAATSASFTNGAVFSAGSSEPTSDGEIWFKQSPNNASPPCDAQGWHWKTGGSWVPVPVPAAALPATAVTAGTYGQASKIPRITVGADGRVTAAEEVDPDAEATDGHAKAWIKFTHSEIGSLPSSKNLNISSITNSGTGQYTITTAAGLFTTVCVCVASAPGFGWDEAQGTASYTGADHVRITSTSVDSTGYAVIGVNLPRMQYDSENTWDNNGGDAPSEGVHLVMFGK